MRKMIVIIDGKEAEREVDYVKMDDGILREIPVLAHNEQVMHVVHGPPHIISWPD